MSLPIFPLSQLVLSHHSLIHLVPYLTIDTYGPSSRRILSKYTFSQVIPYPILPLHLLCYHPHHQIFTEPHCSEVKQTFQCRSFLGVSKCWIRRIGPGLLTGTLTTDKNLDWTSAERGDGRNWGRCGAEREHGCGEGTQL